MRLIFTSLSVAALSLVLSACGDGGDDDGGSGGSTSNSSTSAAATNGVTTGSNMGDPEPAEQAGMTAAHNAARASVSPPAASPIPPLAWDADLAAVAQAYAEKCVFEHSGGPYGENLYAESGLGASPQDVVDSWVSEDADYDYATNGCSGVCGHYTQVVWADSRRLGCGVASCSQSSPFGSGSWVIWVCNYDPPGNYVGEKPY